MGLTEPIQLYSHLAAGYKRGIVRIQCIWIGSTRRRRRRRRRRRSRRRRSRRRRSRRRRRRKWRQNNRWLLPCNAESFSCSKCCKNQLHNYERRQVSFVCVSTCVIPVVTSVVLLYFTAVYVHTNMTSRAHILINVIYSIASCNRYIA